jgi:hypothetical protein
MLNHCFPSPTNRGNEGIKVAEEYISLPHILMRITGRRDYLWKQDLQFRKFYLLGYSHQLRSVSFSHSTFITGLDVHFGPSDTSLINSTHNILLTQVIVPCTSVDMKHMENFHVISRLCHAAYIFKVKL